VVQTIDARFLPFEKSDDSNWRHRPYFIEAVTDIDNIHVSRPYFPSPALSAVLPFLAPS